MIFRSFKVFTATLFTLFVVVACGGDPAPAATGLVAKATESTVTVSWDMVPGVDYTLYFGPTIIAPTDVSSMSKWIGLLGGGSKINPTSPYVVSGLVNGLSYSFSVNGRTNGGPGGPGATPVSVTPMIAGTNWSSGPAIGSNVLRGVTYGATFVAVGTGGAMYSSADGAAWSAINYVTNANLNGANYFGTYKIVGDSGLLLVSSDAVTWVSQNSGSTQNLYAIANNGLNLNVAVGANGAIVTSPDGITWTAAASTTTNHLYGVTYSTYNGGTWVAVGAAGTIVESPDAVTWHSVTSNALADLRGIAYGASTSATSATTFVAVGASGTVLSSTDGITWVSQVPPLMNNINAVAYGAQFVAVGSGGNIFTSTDGVAWTASAASGTSNDLNAVTRGVLAYSAVGVLGANLLAK